MRTIVGTRDLSLAGALCSLGVLMILAFTSRYGIGISPDSAVYISVARNLIAGRGLLQYDGEMCVSWPPLYPTLLAALSLVGLDAADAARYVSAVAYGLIILVSYLWLAKNIRFFPLVLLGAAAVAFSIPLVNVSVMAWTEPLFVLCVQVFTLEIGCFLRSGKLSALLLAATLAALACLIRYIGYTVVLTGLILLLFRRASVGRRLTDVTAFSLISVLPVGTWVARNYLLYSSLTGPRGAAVYTIFQNVGFTLNVMSRWLIPPSIPLDAGISFLSLLLTASACALLIIGYRHRRGAGSSLRPVAAPGSFFIVYAGGLVAATTLVTLTSININPRYVSPLYVPWLLTILFAADSALLLNKRLPDRVLKAVLLVVLAAGLIYPVSTVIKTGSRLIADGAGGYSTTLWQEAAIVDYLRNHPPQGEVYSNAPHGVYALTGLDAGYSPRKNLLHSDPDFVPDDIPRINQSLDSGNDVYLVWLENRPVPHFSSIVELQSLFVLEPVVAFPDGSVYRVFPLPAP